MSENKIYSILIAEDDTGIQAQYKIILEKAGYSVQAANSYQEAINFIGTYSFDVAIIDVRLDKDDDMNADGLRILAQISKLENKPQAILATGLRGKYPGLEDYAYAIWDKGQELSTLVNKVKEALDEKEKISPARIKQSLHLIIAEMARKKLGLEDVCKLILDEMVALISAEAANLSLVLDNILIVKATTKGEIGRRLLVEDSISGWAVRRQTGVYIPDINADQRAKKLYKQGLGKNIQSEFVVPLMIGVEPIAVLNFESSERDAFNPSEIRLIEELAGQVAIAINSARLHNQTNSVIRLSEISSEINASIDKGETTVADIVVDKMLEFLKCDKAAICNYDTDLTKIYFIAHRGLNQEYTLSPNLHMGSPRTLVAQTRQPVIIYDIYKDERFISIRDLATKEGYSAILELPLLIRDKMVGSIAAYYTDAHYFDSEEVALARLFADHVAVALNNAQQYQTLQELKEREKKEAEERLVAEITHRLTNPLGSIRAWVIEIEKKYSNVFEVNADLGKKFSMVKQSSAKAMELISLIKDEQGKLYAESIDIKEHLLLAMRDEKIKEGLVQIEFKMILPQQKLLVRADKELWRIFVNLIENSLEALTNELKIIEISVSVQDSYVEVLVSDTGRGIPPDNKLDIFKPWYSSKEESDGLHGMGLPWVKRYIQTYGGKIDLVQSHPQKGTTLRFSLLRAVLDDDSMLEKILSK